jgi:chromosome segregation ATPase
MKPRFTISYSTLLKSEKDRISDLTRKLKMIAKSRKDYQAENEELKLKVSHLEQNVERVIDGSEESNKIISECQTKIREILEELENKNVQTKKLGEELSEAEGKLQKLNKVNAQLEKAAANFASEKSKSKAIEDKLAQKVAVSKKIIEKLKKDSDLSKTAVEELNKKCSAIDKQKLEIEKQLKSSISDKESQKNTLVSSLEGKNEILKQKIEAAENIQEKLKSHNKTLLSEKETLQVEFDKVSAKSQSAEKLIKDSDSSKAAVEKLKKKCLEIEKQKSKIEKDLKKALSGKESKNNSLALTLENEIENFKQKINSAETLQEELKSHNKTLLGEKEILRVEFEEISAASQSSNTQLIELKELYENSQDDHNSLKQALEIARKQFESAQVTLIPLQAEYEETAKKNKPMNLKI